MQILVVCPHCLGDGEEPGAPIDDLGTAICTLCNGSGEVPESIAIEYEND